MAPEKVREIMNRCFDGMVEAVNRYDGTVDKFIGDAIMSFWGAPIKNERHAQAALNSALEMLHRLEQVNEELLRRGFEPLAIGIGLNTGEVVLGNIGSARKINYTVIGDSVNLAARLEGVTKTYGTPIILSQFTFDALDGSVPCGLVDVVRVKGKKEPVRLYRPLVGHGAGADEAERARALAREFEAAFDHYLARRWEEASEAFSALPADRVTAQMIERCRHYREEPPPADWDGVLTYTTK